MKGAKDYRRRHESVDDYDYEDELGDDYPFEYVDGKKEMKDGSGMIKESEAEA